MLNPLSADQLKIGRRRPINFRWALLTYFLFDLQKVDIVEKVFLYLNVDVLFVLKWVSYDRLGFGKLTLPGSIWSGLHLLASMPTRNTIRGWAMNEEEASFWLAKEQAS